ncbi:hypothetical protein PhCBS80983_g05232 [Powellomyces hirtus]|uniref:Transcription factor IIIC subunit 5 HTH domain-containing protein n=1 Tax=Powellomyces hirtus TaxID=109895 RepID=A0A507DVP1_9FUNG|nr:hypothetical protein PhCBS80983_g05232 [Powellomyces hirtus]
MDYEPAPSQVLPGWNFHVVEYPGYVKNPEKVLATLGGAEAIEKAFADDLNVLELRYRPDDPFSHPINGEIIHTANILLRVTTRRRRQKSMGPSGDKRQDTVRRDNQEPKVTTTFLGTVTKTCRFRAIADYQWLIDPNDPMGQLRRSMHNFDADGIEKFTLQLDKGPRKNLRNMPPPSFSRIEWPLDYGYRQNMAVVKVLIRRNDDAPPEMKLINRYRRQKFSAIQFSHNDKVVPSGPPLGASTANVPPEALTAMRQLFEKRSMWTRAALLNSMPKAYHSFMKVLLPLHAYVVTSGPWRECWIRYGYDFRVDPEARFGQIIDVRFVRNPRSFARAKRLIGVVEPTQLVSGRPSVTPGWTDRESTADPHMTPTTSNESHIFDGVTPTDLGTFQMCDVTDPDVLKMIHTKRHLRHKCHERDGWYARRHYDLIRDVTKKKIQLIQGKDVNINFHWDEDEGCSDHGSEEDAVGSADEEVQPLPASSLPVEIEATVKSKVDALMKSLQTAQKGALDDEEDVVAREGEEAGEFDYFDVFGDEDDEDD